MNENDRLKRLLVVEQITHLLLQSALIRSSPEDRERFRRDFVERIRRQTISG